MPTVYACCVRLWAAPHQTAGALQLPHPLLLSAPKLVGFLAGHSDGLMTAAIHTKLSERCAGDKADKSMWSAVLQELQQLSSLHTGMLCAVCMRSPLRGVAAAMPLLRPLLRGTETSSPSASAAEAAAPAAPPDAVAFDDVLRLPEARPRAGVSKAAVVPGTGAAAASSSAASASAPAASASAPAAVPLSPCSSCRACIAAADKGACKPATEYAAQ